MGSAHSLVRDYARHRFAILFAVLLLAIAGHGLVGKITRVANPLEWLLAFGLLAIVFSARVVWVRWLLAGLTVVSLAAKLTDRLVDHPAPLLLSQSLVAIACLVAAAVAIHHAFAQGRVDSERICAALDAYLLVGIAFGVGYWLIESAWPGSFSSVSTQGFTPARAIYFSFVTQATLGFGDVVPLGEHSQGVVVAQGIGGQMYLAVLIARLVSLYSADDES